MMAVWSLVYQNKVFAQHHVNWDVWEQRTMPEWLNIWARHLGLNQCRLFWSPAERPQIRQMSQAGKASIRQKRLKARMAAKFPLFADAFTQEEIDRDPDYFSATTNERRRK